MSLLCDVVRRVTDLVSVRTELLLWLYSKLGLYKRIFAFTGFSAEAASKLERGLLEVDRHIVEKRHELAKRWALGDLGVFDAFEHYRVWQCEQTNIALSDALASTNAPNTQRGAVSKQ